MPRLTDTRKELRRTQITEAAVRCFSRNGLERTSIADITAESGLSAGSIYAHYRSKADLVQASAHALLAERAEALGEYAASDSPPDPAEARAGVQTWGEATTNPAIRHIVADTVDRMRAHPGSQRPVEVDRDQRPQPPAPHPLAQPPAERPVRRQRPGPPGPAVPLSRHTNSAITGSSSACATSTTLGRTAASRATARQYQKSPPASPPARVCSRAGHLTAPVPTPGTGATSCSLPSAARPRALLTTRQQRQERDDFLDELLRDRFPKRGLRQCPRQRRPSRSRYAPKRRDQPSPSIRADCQILIAEPPVMHGYALN
ncbi:TetR family transcriptional regulator [Kitasatospora sp. NPDC059803]|uniref:TetR family transcriptional regulator n=1 Tax=Kitasatospora sp. NPDC059803 TaxID=3346953 RepID=UPI00364D0186